MYGSDRYQGNSADPPQRHISPSKSFIYPVKSLLTGIQPAQEQAGGVSRTAVSSVGAPPSPELSKWIAGEVERAQLGLVHLGPISTASRSSTSGSLLHSFDDRIEQSPSCPPDTSERSNSSDLLATDNNGRSASHEDNTSAQPEEPLFTVRFQAMQDEHGHHVVLGREGKLTRCEDEPIRTPGAVQGFGVLIVVDEKDDVLVVRQVSENSTQLLGLSPRYLFSLDCFTDTLPESQADLLWNNVQFLSEPGSQPSDDRHDVPHIFRISGWGAPGTANDLPDVAALDRDSSEDRCLWTCCATGPNSKLFVMEFELEVDVLNPLYPPVSLPKATNPALLGQIASGSSSDMIPAELHWVLVISAPCRAHVVIQATKPLGDDTWTPSSVDIMESTISVSKPLPALERLRRLERITTSEPTSGKSRSRRGKKAVIPGGSDMMDVLAIMAQINEQLGDPPDLETFLKVVVGIIKDLTQFHRVLVYQFDERWNGQVVAELVDWEMTHDLYKGLHFPAGDIPTQATARIVVRSKEDLEQPLDMTHCHLRAMSPIHIKYLGNMGVRASMSVSIMAFGTLWGLVTCHSYGALGMRVSLPTREMLKLLSQSISRNIERLSYAQRLHTRKLINTMASENHPTGYIVSDFDSLLSLFDADFGILVIGDGAKILGPNANEHGQEILIMAEYLRLKQFGTIQVSQAVTTDYPDLKISTGLDVVAGLMYVPLSSGGKDFIAFLRKGQPRDVHWAGKPFKGDGSKAVLEPRKSFKIWSETVAGRCRAWTDEQLETAGVLALVYGKFIEVWRQKENVLQTTKLTNLLLSNASHEVRTPLNHIINYLEMALNGPLDSETRDNLSQSHSASKACGNETSFNQTFNLPAAVEEAISPYRIEAQRQSIDFVLDISGSPKEVIGDARKIKTVVQNLTANALKYTVEGSITVCCVPTQEPVGLHNSQQTVVEIVVADTGCGIRQEKLENIFREFEKVESSEPKPSADAGVGLGLAVVARIVEQLGGQLRVDSRVEQGSRFSFLIPLSFHTGGANTLSSSSRASSSDSLRIRSRPPSITSANEIDSLVEAISSNHKGPKSSSLKSSPSLEDQRNIDGFPNISKKRSEGTFEVVGSQVPVRPIKMDENINTPSANLRLGSVPPISAHESRAATSLGPSQNYASSKLRVLIVEDNILNQKLLAKRLRLDGHTVVNTMNGQEGLDTVRADRDFDCVLMDLSMPILNGFEATEQIRGVEAKSPSSTLRLSHRLNGRIPIFAVSASLFEQQRDKLSKCGMDGWILKPIDFKRLGVILSGVTDVGQRQRDLYRPGCNWESGGWLREHLPLDS
ncbi:phytochrome-like protein [Armillaria mellea]|nr:phytochrome-like protein [Armillaria mellea]